MKNLLISNPDCARHAIDGHPEKPERLAAVMNRLESSGLLKDMEQISAREISAPQLSLAHSADYVNLVEASEVQNEVVQLDPDTFLGPGSLRAAKLAAGAVVQATEQVIQGVARRAFCAIRPPGHHAELAAAMGFCIFNNIAVATTFALEILPSTRSRFAILMFTIATALSIYSRTTKEYWSVPAFRIIFTLTAILTLPTNTSSIRHLNQGQKV